MSSQEVIDALSSDEYMRVGEILEKVNINEQNLYSHLTGLVKEGLVTTKKEKWKDNVMITYYKLVSSDIEVQRVMTSLNRWGSTVNKGTLALAMILKELRDLRKELKESRGGSNGKS